MKPSSNNNLSSPRKQRAMNHTSSSSYTFLLVCITILLFLTCSSNTSSSRTFFTCAKEIEATNEWQLLGPDDTIPAGLHVRMDLETGQKWVKLMDEEEGDGVDPTIAPSATPTDDAASVNVGTGLSTSSIDSSGSSTSINILPKEKEEESDDVKSSTSQASIDATTGNVKITQLDNTKISSEQSSKITSTLLAQAEREQQQQQQQQQIHKNKLESIASLNDFESSQYEHELDYEMMYRTLQSLPIQDQLEMGLPKAEPSPQASQEEWNTFIQQIKDIWHTRQEQLKRMEEEYLADIPDIIRDRVSFLEHYITSPLTHLYQIAMIKEEELDPHETIDDRVDILTVLEDLEFQLSDLDLARDFHIMGGWPILVSLLTDSIHQVNQINWNLKKNADFLSALSHVNDTSSISSEASLDHVISKMHGAVMKVQMLASWVIGTAVKNVDEFHSWCMEDLSHLIVDDGDRTSSSQDNEVIPTNLISILASKLQDNVAIEYDLVASDAVKGRMKLLQKQLYALGATLRGNRAATSVFTRLPEGPTVLVDLLNSIMKMDKIERDAKKVILKIVTFVDDMIQDVTLHPASESDGEMSKGVDDQIIASFSSNEWCDVPSQVLPRLSETSQYQVHQMMVTLSPFCSYDDHLIQDLKMKMDL